MRAPRKAAFALPLLVIVIPAFAQSTGTPPASPVTRAQPAPRVHRRLARRQTPCWRTAGIAPELINREWEIHDDAHGKINEVCSDATLTAEQKLAKIREIDQEAEQEIAKLIPTKQLEMYRTCQAQEASAKPVSASEKRLGPCGGVIPSSPVASGNVVHEHHAESPPMN